MFKGSQSIAVPPMGRWPSLTVSFWLRLTALPTDAPQTVYRSGPAGAAGTVSVQVNPQGRVTLAVVGNTPAQAVFETGAGHNPLVAFEWYQVGVTYSKRHAGRTGTGSTTLYLGGEAVETLGFSAAAESTVEVALGDGALGEALTGILDEVRIYSRAVGPAEMKDQPYGRLSGKEDSLLAYYRMDEGARGTLRDHTPVAPPAVDVPHDATFAPGTPSAPEWVISWAPFESCVLRCSNQGFCQVKQIDGFDKQVCKCDNGFAGDDCETRLCDGAPRPCSGHGVCSQKKAMEVKGRVPPMPSVDELKVEAEQLKLSFSNTALMTDKFNSSVSNAVQQVDSDAMEAWEAARQELIWTCDCELGWGGADGTCSGRSCPGNCGGHGTCGEDGSCICNEGYRGLDCAILTCPNDCSDQGQCMNGTCVCDAGFSGEDCSTSNLCANDCSGHGRCDNGYVSFWVCFIYMRAPPVSSKSCPRPHRILCICFCCVVCLFVCLYIRSHCFSASAGANPCTQETTAAGQRRATTFARGEASA